MDSPQKKTSSKAPSSFFVRLASGVVYVALIVAAIFGGVYPLAFLLAIFAGIGAYEFYRMARIEGRSPHFLMGILAAAAYPLVALTGVAYVNLVTLVLIVAVCFWYIINVRTRLSDVSVTVFGSLYAGLLISALVYIRHIGDGLDGALFTLCLFGSVWVNDSFAYVFGSLLGKHKLVPKISPKKSWEGFIAGVIGSTLVWIIPAFIPSLDFPLPLAIITGVICGTVGVIGDLVESRIKRGAGVKDSGNLIPGHGGMLDRIDSLILVSITAYFILRIGGML